MCKKTVHGIGALWGRFDRACALPEGCILCGHLWGCFSDALRVHQRYLGSLGAPRSFKIFALLHACSFLRVCLTKKPISSWHFQNPHSRPENLKKSRPKKLVKSNKSISWNFFWPNSIFCNFKNGQISIFELGKSLKLPKMQFYEKKDLFDFTSFFAWIFLNFLARCVCWSDCSSRIQVQGLHTGTSLGFQNTWCNY